MKIRAFRSFHDPQPLVREVAAVVIEKNDGTPVAAASQVAGELCCFTTVEDPNFHRHLQMLGLDRVVVVEDLSSVVDDPQSFRKLPSLIEAKR